VRGNGYLYLVRAVRVIGAPSDHITCMFLYPESSCYGISPVIFRIFPHFMTIPSRATMLPIRDAASADGNYSPLISNRALAIAFSNFIRFDYF
jgi:hypothetical protein